ncbi:sushi, von Willebrand factor type A, EGF and pentraxin domain-containing protein 1-like isoform X2 [Oscarella lobularis]|uniref:sushi, von Willebrand factor type A, EGF and pentraxin domain-containing protein 1-like isoform X2 n=1 Tax=Oscarella lobularis TaxID=121494 RepID=UPI003313A996
MLQVFFFVLIATGSAIGQSQVDDIQCHGLLNWSIVKPKAHLGSSPFNSKTVALNAVDGVVPNTAEGQFEKCAITKGGTAKKSLTIDLHRTYLISSVKTYLRQNWRAIWQNGLKVYVGPNNNTHEGNTQCGLAYIHQRDNPNYEPVFNCSPPVEGRFVFFLKNDANERDSVRSQGLQVCEVAVKGAVTCNQSAPLIQNATVEYNCTPWNALEATYRCNEGYVSNGGYNISTCFGNETWSQPSLNCILLCPDVTVPSPPLTLSIEDNDNVIGSKRNYSCNDSCYELIGTANQACVYSSDGRQAVWSSEVPTCEKIECGLAPIINFTTSTVDSTTCGGTATYKCVEGYEMVGSPNVTCSTNGKWGELPSCEPVRCPSPVGDSTQLQTNSSDFTYSNVIQFSCKSNRRLVVGSKTSQCLSNGKWSHEPPKCKRPFCIFTLPQKTFEDNKNETKIYADGGKVKFSCKEGYKLTGSQTVHCKSNGISVNGYWNSDFPTCKRISCSHPKLSQKLIWINGSRDNYYNDTAFYRCAEGYIPQIPQKFRCGLKETWEAVKKQEQCSPVDCEKPGDPGNGYHRQLSNNYKFTAEIEYACYYGYELQGEKKASCQSTGNWGPQSPPTCKVMTCPDLPQLKFGSVEVTGNHVNDTATFKSNSGYNLVGPETITCKVINSTASWSHAPPTIKAKKCVRPRAPVNGEIVGHHFRYSKTIKFVCDQGYVLTPAAKSVWRCSENGKWKDNKQKETNFPTCEPVDCGKPDDPLYGYHKKLSNNYKFNAEVEYACYYGYTLQGKEKAVCQSTGNWDPSSPPTCQVMKCPGLASPEFGTVQLEGRNVNDTAKFICNSSYDLVGHKAVTCKVINKVASWSHVSPMCKPKQCGAPPVPRNGRVVGEDFHYPKTIEFACNRGYVLTPENPVWKCSEDEKWKDNERRETKFPTCEPVNCGEPSMIPNGKYEGKEFTFGKNITYECNPGFKRSAWVQSTCLYTGNWSLPPPQCSQIYCPYLSSPDNGRTELSAGLSFGSVVTFSCDPGYDVTINSRKANVETVQLKCEQEGKQEEARGDWRGTLTSQPPTCQPKDCGPLPDIPNGKVVFIPNTFYPGKAHYSCNPGFQIAEEEDAAIRSCGTNGIWEGIEPHCEPVSCGAPPTISNGLYKGELFTFGHNVTYHCNVGYERSGSAELECTHTGQWSSSFPNCSAVNCGAPPTVRNGHFRGNNFLFGSKVEYYCDRGFKRVRSSTLECIHTSKWYPAPTKCLELLCPYWRAPKNGEIWFSGLIVGSIVHYSCNPGYTIAINDEKVDDIERVSFRCIQIGDQDTARSMWKGALTSMPPTCKPSNN